MQLGSPPWRGRTEAAHLVAYFVVKADEVINLPDTGEKTGPKSSMNCA